MTLEAGTDLQIQQRQDADRKPPKHEILFVVRDDDGLHGLNGRGFGWQAYEYQTSLKVEEGLPPRSVKTGAAR